MTKTELLDALRAATEPSRELDAEIEICIGGGEVVWKIANYTMEQYPAIRRPSKHHVGGFANEHCPLLTASLDAANAFRERMLPGWELALAGPWRYAEGHERAGQEAWYAEVCDCFEDSGLGYTQVNNLEHRGATPAIALCAAVIAALIAQDAQNAD